MRRGAVAVERSEVARAVDERIAQRERLRHADERLVERGVAVRMVVAHHVADDLRALAVLGVGGEVLLPHRVEDAALHRLQAVANVGQRARRDDRERVVQVARLRRLVQRDALVSRPGAAASGRLRQGRYRTGTEISRTSGTSVLPRQEILVRGQRPRAKGPSKSVLPGPSALGPGRLIGATAGSRFSDEARARAVSLERYGAREAVWSGTVLALAWPMGVLADLRYSARSLRRTPGLTLALLLTIALGIGSNAVVFGFIRGFVTRDLPHHRHRVDRLNLCSRRAGRFRSDLLRTVPGAPVAILDL